MINPVKVFDAEGNLKGIVSSDELEKRSDKIIEGKIQLTKSKSQPSTVIIEKPDKDFKFDEIVKALISVPKKPKVHKQPKPKKRPEPEHDPLVKCPICNQDNALDFFDGDDSVKFGIAWLVECRECELWFRQVLKTESFELIDKPDYAGDVEP